MTTTRPTWLLLAALVLAEVSSAFEITMIYACLPTLHRTFANPIGVGWAITSCLLVSSVAAALCGRLGDLMGRRRVLIVVLVLCAIGSLTSALSATLTGVVIGVSIQGISGAILPLCFGLARETLPGQRVAFGVGVVTAAGALGGGLGLVTGGAIVDRFAWNTVFFTSGTMAALGAIAILVVVPAGARQTASREGVDFVIGVLFAPAVAGLLIAVSKISTWGLRDSRTLALTAASLALLVFWARHQSHQRNPLINVRLIAERKIALAYCCMACLAVGPMQFTQAMSLFLQQPRSTGAGLGLSATAAGLLLLPASWIGLIASPWSGKLAERFGARLPALLGGALIAATWTMLALAHESLSIVTIAMVSAIFGFSLVYAAIPNLILESAPAERTSEATGVATVVRALFMAIGAQALTLVLASDTTGGEGTTRYPTNEAFTQLFAYIAVLGVICMAAAYAVSPRLRLLLARERSTTYET